jgi:SAM-dependent methyltransferase
MKNNYEYNEPMVRFYDVVYENMAELGKEFYVNKMTGISDPVLEIGCGTGRLFTSALKRGADVYGIDQSELMLSKLKDKIEEKEHYRVQHADAREYVSDKKFKLIIAPFRVFQHIYSTSDQIKFLESVKRNLAEEGIFIFDVFNPDLEYIGKGYDKKLQFTGEYSPGKIIKRYHTGKPDIVNQLMHITFRFEWDENNEIKHAEFYTPMRYYFRFELEHLIARSGLKLKNIYGDYKENELTSESLNFIVECTK